MKGFCGFLVTLLLAAFGEPAPGAVSVRGHFRRDGTYVQPHHRTAPDGNFYNNWSTKGNLNPYTGEEGNVVTPPINGSVGGLRLPSTYVPKLPVQSDVPSVTGGTVALPRGSVSSPTSSFTDLEQEIRKSTAIRLRELGHEVDWKTTSLLDMTDMETRLRASTRLRELGHSVDWKTNSLPDMMEIDTRIRAAQRLQDLGHKVDWKTTSLLGMMDMENRIRASNRLRDFGYSVDWKDHSLVDMTDMDSRIRAARHLKAGGIDVNWQKHSLIELLEMQSQARR